MADIQPIDVFASAGERNTDGLTLANGFPAAQKPARQWFNWLFNGVTTKINELVTAVNALQNSTDWQLPVNAIVEIDEVLTVAQFATKIGYGTWVVYGEGRVVVGAGSVTIDYSAATGDAARPDITQTFAVGDLGGEIDHKQRLAELKDHKHPFPIIDATGDVELNDEFDPASYVLTPDEDQVLFNDTLQTDNGYGMKLSDHGKAGGGEPFNVMQPYIVASRFKRTA